MKLILVRHGETEENQKDIVQGHLPGKLSEKGKKQAKKLGLRLKNKKIDAIYSSDLARALDTAKEISKFHPKVPLKQVKDLRERNYGKLVGKKLSKLDIKKMPLYVETKESMMARALKLLERVYAKYPKRNVLFVGHAGINKAIISVIMDKPASYMKEVSHPKNTGVNVFDIRAFKKNIVHLRGCTRHLE